MRRIVTEQLSHSVKSSIRRFV